jgi:hypothetical protein
MEYREYSQVSLSMPTSDVCSVKLYCLKSKPTRTVTLSPLHIFCFEGMSPANISCSQEKLARMDQNMLFVHSLYSEL